MHDFWITKKGFTLIELLIVMAVLGVLAAIVLVAINPAEQLARGRDSSRLQSVAQLGHAMQAYVTSQGSFPSTNGVNPTLPWQENFLVSSGDLKQVISVSPTLNTGSCTQNAQGNICYVNVYTGSVITDAIIYTVVESKSETVRAESTKPEWNCGENPGSNLTDSRPGVAAYMWIASQGKAGVTCIGRTGYDVLPSYVLK